MKPAERNVLIAAYGLVVYLAFLSAFAYFVGFLANAFVPKSVDSGAAGSVAVAVAVDVALLALFGVQHSVMARRSFKQAWTRVVPPAAERSTYVLASTLVIVVMCWLWQPLPYALWSFGGVAGAIGWGVFALGWLLVFVASCMIDHLELFGLRQSLALGERHAPNPGRLRTPALYRFVRHPLYTAFMIALWATPKMTVGHALLAAGFTIYVLIGARYEERDLVAQFGEQYLEYRRQVPMLVPHKAPLPKAD